MAKGATYPLSRFLLLAQIDAFVMVTVGAVCVGLTWLAIASKKVRSLEASSVGPSLAFWRVRKIE